ncbi:MAG: thioredoxin fold domain-containing protein [Gammaproteobacteria bacterium]|nr:thioredoxin fold domain-containing protein [Gammaproteobacteria bacterium]
MSNRIILILLGALFSVYVHAETKTQGKITGGIDHKMPSWFSDSFLDINEDVAEARKNNKTIMLFFHLNECPYCDAMLNENFIKGSTKKFIQDNFSVIAINTKGDREITINQITDLTEKTLSQQLKVQYTPTIVFLNQENKTVFRINGYRSPTAFKHVLNYINDKAYERMKLSSYMEKYSVNKEANYRFIPHKSLQKVNYFKGYKKPVAILFEDKNCTDCDFLHKNVINQSDVISEIDKFLFVRLDAYSDDKIIDFYGKETTARKWADELGLNYRPGIVLFDNMNEITRIDGKLYSFHFKEVFRYVSGKYYMKFSSYNKYLAVRQEELINKGIDIDITK